MTPCSALGTWQWGRGLTDDILRAPCHHWVERGALPMECDDRCVCHCQHEARLKENSSKEGFPVRHDCGKKEAVRISRSPQTQTGLQIT